MDRLKTLRRAAALTGVATVALMASVIPANADAVTGQTAGDYRGGEGVFMTGGQGDHDPNKVIHTSVIRLKTSTGEELQTYCIDFFTPTDDSKTYAEVPWNTYNGPYAHFDKNAPKINWVLHNSYPEIIDTSLIQKAAEAADPKTKFDHALSDWEAIAGTQAALWTFSNDMKLDTKKPTESPEHATNVVALYNYLTGPANKGLAEPKPGLTLDPAKLAGKTGAVNGPITVVGTNLSDVVVSAKLPQGVELTDKDGKTLDDAKKDAKKAAAAADSKAEFYVKVAEGTADGKVDINVKGTASLSPGRIFVSKDKKGNDGSQILVLAASEKVKLEAKGEVSWSKVTTPPTTETTPAPQGKNTEELANTGASIMTPVLIGVVLVAGGVGALVFQRKRRKV